VVTGFEDNRLIKVGFQRRDVMKKTVLVMVAVFLLASGVYFGWTTKNALAGEGEKILAFDTMVGVPRPYTGGDNAIRGVSGGGLPWVIESGKGKLKADGDLEVKVTGLVLDPNDPDVISRGLAGNNPIPEFKAIVSCLSVDGSGDAITVNLTTDPFPATTGVGGGDADIRAHLDLPDPCIAPIIFVTSPGGAWFSSTGF
jgi:hypothetical protein